VFEFKITMMFASDVTNRFHWWCSCGFIYYRYIEGVPCIFIYVSFLYFIGYFK